MKPSSRGRIWPFLGAVGLAALIAALLAPYLYAEYLFDLRGQVPVLLPRAEAPLTGRWVDDYFVVQSLDPTTYAIGEPRTTRETTAI